MNRVYKFRAWHKVRQRMLTDEFMNVSLMASLDVTLNHVSDLIVMEWTGLTDHAGHPVYEGDIIRWGENISAIRWNGHLAQFGFYWLDASKPEGSNKRWHYEDSCGALVAMDYEVIGNIHQNLDLLIS